MFTFETTVRVRYAETDKMGYVYYGNYASFYEVGRNEMFRSTGISYKELEEMGIMLPVSEMRTRFIHPARYDDLITIKVIIREMPVVRIQFEYELYNEQRELINEGYTQLVFVDMQKNKPCRAPEIFNEKIRPYFE